MIKRAVRFATLMFAVSVPMWLGLSEPGASQAHATGAETLAPRFTSAESTQATANSAMSTQSVWHVMALSSR